MFSVASDELIGISELPEICLQNDSKAGQKAMNLNKFGKNRTSGNSEVFYYCFNPCFSSHARLKDDGAMK